MKEVIKMNNETALEWVSDRIVFILANCDFEDEDNKKAYDVLTYIEKVLEGKEG